MLFTGKSVLITGASAGLGKEMVYAFAKQGATVGMIARRAEKLKEIEEDINKLNIGGKVIPLVCDVSHKLALEDAFDSFVSQTGQLDVLINNAGMAVFGRVPTEEELLKVYDINVHTVYRLSLIALPYLEKTGGNIINFGSMVTERSVAGEFVYNSTKGAVKAMTKAMAGTWGKKGVRVNLIQPGIIESEFNLTAGVPPEIARENYEASKELNELPMTGSPEDVANAAVFLASDQARFITGINLKVDGGISLASIRRDNAAQTSIGQENVSLASIKG